ncbi:MAG TPA: trimeric intracellular cation channel family protein [Eoetvoesiella sp.]|uniref:trimeric intracellular cation channel family protein n=1 Tax=Eoetvoesiella sp. TaxID=1966355 RepID=UPI002C649A84|nr:trimeric intracellular cation channel family protein [Eoetvoesiella sp.]HWK60185.1 trimeric intracellular cation channel family protein [Eoetvoesiella sp.]
MNEHMFFTALDMLGTFAFAISGAVAARQKRLDLFGVLSIAYIVACGGGIMRDVAIGAIPPAGLSDWRYLAVAVLASLLTIACYPLVKRMTNPVQLFDALGLGFFAVFGAHKSLVYGHNIEVAVMLGVTAAVGGGVLRDVLLNRTPLILRKEIYASAALVAAVIQVLGDTFAWPQQWVPWVGIVICFALRYLSLSYRWNLPRFSDGPG